MIGDLNVSTLTYVKETYNDSGPNCIVVEVAPSLKVLVGNHGYSASGTS